MEEMEEMEKLRKALDDRGIEWVDDSNEKLTRTKWSRGNTIYSVIYGVISYGYDEGLLELGKYTKSNPMSNPMDIDVLGWCTAEDVLRLAKL